MLHSFKPITSSKLGSWANLFLTWVLVNMNHTTSHSANCNVETLEILGQAIFFSINGNASQSLSPNSLAVSSPSLDKPPKCHGNLALGLNWAEWQFCRLWPVSFPHFRNKDSRDANTGCLPLVKWREEWSPYLDSLVVLRTFRGNSESASEHLENVWEVVAMFGWNCLYRTPNLLFLCTFWRIWDINSV